MAAPGGMHGADTEIREENRVLSLLNTPAQFPVQLAKDARVLLAQP
jgi:hypothetical protein